MFDYVARHDPAVILGFVFLAISAAVVFHIQVKLIRAGQPPMFLMGWDASLKYFKIRKQHGWPAWPAHCVWLGIPLGLAIFCFGVLRL